jgi:hypothetical protein
LNPSRTTATTIDSSETPSRYHQRMGRRLVLHSGLFSCMQRAGGRSSDVASRHCRAVNAAARATSGVLVQVRGVHSQRLKMNAVAVSRARHTTQARVAVTFAATVAYISCGVIETGPKDDHDHDDSDTHAPPTHTRSHTRSYPYQQNPKLVSRRFLNSFSAPVVLPSRLAPRARPVRPATGEARRGRRRGRKPPRGAAPSWS